MKVANCDQMKRIDSNSINNFKIPGIVLMENAAMKVVKEAENFLGEMKYKSVIIFCGKGNNGGDGYAVARHLFNQGVNVFVIILSTREDIKGDALINLEIIEKLGIKIVYAIDDTFLESIATSIYLCDLVIDAIYGTGIKGEVKGLAKNVIELINSSSSNILSVDIPSGINGNTGQICGVCVRADKTVTFGLPKIGVINYPGSDYCGELVIANISIPQCVIDSEKIHINMIDRELVKSMCPVRKKQSNKGNYGKVFIVAGSKGMTGAAVLSSHSALKTGSGLVTVGIPKTLNQIIEMKLTEVMSYPLDDTGDGILTIESAEKILEKAKKSDVLVFGPGLSSNESIKKILGKIIKNYSGALVIDADGLNVLATNINILRGLSNQIIVTPHPGEMSRLTGYDIEYIQKNRIMVASDFSKKWGVIVVLKGARTVIAWPDGEVFINMTGNSGMATAGMGDVLSGVIASLIGQGLNSKDASVYGVYVHGFAGDIASENKGLHGLTSVDVIEQIPKTLKILGGY